MPFFHPLFFPKDNRQAVSVPKTEKLGLQFLGRLLPRGQYFRTAARDNLRRTTIAFDAYETLQSPVVAHIIPGVTKIVNDYFHFLDDSEHEKSTFFYIMRRKFFQL